MTSLAERSQVIALLTDAIAAGARQDRACAAISFSERTMQRWQRDEHRGDQRPLRVQASANRLSVLERQSFRVWPTAGNTLHRNRRSIAC